MNLAEFARFNDYLVGAFPLAHATMTREMVAPCSQLYIWEGTDPDARPVLLASHTDVVPVEQPQLEQWEHEPFSGDIAGEYIWGRGTLDDKVGVLGLLEAVEALLSAGHHLRRDLVFAFGCDEEVSPRRASRPTR